MIQLGPNVELMPRTNVEMSQLMSKVEMSQPKSKVEIFSLDLRL